jgi:hypothetical protein
MPGAHHFYITFRTDLPGVTLPTRLLAQYPHEMTIVLQHQFWDLKVDEAAGLFSVGLSFSGVPSTLVVPFAAVTAFADPQARVGMRFRPGGGLITVVPTEPAAIAAPTSGSAAADEGGPAGEKQQVVSLDAFRRRPPTKP